VPRASSVLVLVVVTLLIGLAPVAYGDPPDPTWIGGYWDDDDFDNVVVFISGICAIAVASSADAGPVWVPAVRAEPAEPTVRSVLLGALAGPRSPPLSFRSYF
jgi:hypothetical protein